MTKFLEKNSPLIAFPRLFTPEGFDANSLMDWTEKASESIEHRQAIIAPEPWHEVAAETFIDGAGYAKAPAECSFIEENTVPSWLWRKKAKGKKIDAEYNVRVIFDRVVGAAVFKGWKLGLFADEKSARNFFDEARYALASRYIAFEPESLAHQGLSWAYGHDDAAQGAPTALLPPNTYEVSNADIDAVVGGTTAPPIRQKWQRLTLSEKTQTLKASFSDIVADWQSDTATNSRSSTSAAFLDLMAFQDQNGVIKIEALKHATRLLVILIDLAGDDTRAEPTKDASTIGFVNLASLLLAQGLAYDSEQARAEAAAIAAIITGEAYRTSAELAALRGQSPQFKDHREKILRVLRNHRRAVLGDKSDYEKVSVLPQPLSLQNCPNLALVAAAERLWENALSTAQKNGLRSIFVTSLPSLPALRLFLECPTQGLEPLPSLVTTTQDEAGHYRRQLLKAVTFCLRKLGYDSKAIDSLSHHVLGHHTLEKAPYINHTSLRAHGFDSEAIEKIEAYLPYVNSINLAITPWIIGVPFCREHLKISAQKIDNLAFDLLTHLGFREDAIAAANAYCYGHRSIKECGLLRTKHESVLASGEEISVSARLAMAASVQSFISGDVDFTLELPRHISAEKQHKILLDAWRAGIKSVTLILAPEPDTHAEPQTMPNHRETGATFAKRKSKRSVDTTLLLHTHESALPARKSKPKAGSRMLTLAKIKGNTPHSTKDR